MRLLLLNSNTPFYVKISKAKYVLENRILHLTTAVQFRHILPETEKGFGVGITMKAGTI